MTNASIYQGRGDEAKVLVVEDEPVLRDVMRMRLVSDFGVAVTDSAEEALGLIEQEPPDVMLVDKNLPGMSGLELLRLVKDRYVDCEVILITGYASVESALQATRLGAFDYLVKPLESIDIAAEKIRRANEKRNLVRQRSQAEQTIKAREAHYRTLVQTSPDGIMLLELDGTILDANPQMASIIGANENQGSLLGQNAFTFVAKRDRDEVHEKLQQLLTTGRVDHFETRLIRCDGARVVAELSASTMREPDGKPKALVVVVRDVTDLKHLRARLAQSDRLASLGMLAAGVAHEINNPLSYVLYNLDLLSKSLGQASSALSTCRVALSRDLDDQVRDSLGDALTVPEPESLEELVELATEARNGANRVREIVRDLKSFSRVGEDRRGLVEIRSAIESAINMAYNEIKYRASLVKDYGEVLSVMASVGRISQVILNLLVNAAHAIEEGNVEKNQIRIRTYREQDMAVIEVSDTGCGIPTDQLEHLFDPFYSTKENGVGSGLGLFICHNIVSSYGGCIKVESTVDQGSCFRVFLPIPSPDQVLREDPKQIAPPEAPFRRGKILVVDDDLLVAKMFTRILAQHEVSVATSGSQAKNILKQCPDFDLILCDLLMQRTTGMDLYTWLQDNQPELCPKMVFATGGSFTQRSKEFLESISNPVLEKPIDEKRLLKIVGTLLH